LAAVARLLKPFTEDKSKSGFKMPVNMAMEVPGSRIISAESEDCLLIDHDDILANRIGRHKVCGTGRFENLECVSVKMHRVRDASSVELDVVKLVLFKTNQMLGRNEIAGVPGAMDDLKESGNGGREESGCHGALRGGDVHIEEGRAGQQTNSNVEPDGFFAVDGDGSLADRRFVPEPLFLESCESGWGDIERRGREGSIVAEDGTPDGEGAS
jgi:hypothetical protein